MLALVPLLVPVSVAVVTAVVMLALLYGVDYWFRSWVHDDTDPRGSLAGRLLRWGLGRLRRFARRLERKLVHALSHFVAAQSVAIVHLLNNLTELTLRTAGTLHDQAGQLYQALYTLRHVTLPAEIQQALRPVVQRLNTAFALATAATTTLTAVSVEIADGLRALPWGVPQGLPARVRAWLNSYEHLWRQFFDIAQPRVNELWNDRVTSLRDRFNALETQVTTIREQALPAIRQRLGALESFVAGLPAQTQAQLDGLIAPAIFSLAALTALQRLAPNLFCRNTEAVTQRICALDEAFLAQLLAGTLAFGLLLDPRLVARVGQETEGAIEGAYRTMAGL